LSKLGPEAKALVSASRDALRPSGADRQRVLDALRVRIAQAGGQPLAAATPSPVKGSSWQLVSGLVVGAALIGTIAFQLQKPASPAPTAPAVPSIVVAAPAAPAAPVPPAPAAAREPAPLATASVSARPAVQGSGSSRAASGLAEEVALLSRAETELHAGRFGSSLRSLDEYERKFPRGLLVQEDVAARVQALCGLGRVTEATVELKRLSPSSPHASRARAACKLK
jgi:hypothetical protein